MKKNLITTAFLALAGAALSLQPARADVTTGTQGDLLLGFAQTGVANDLVVDIGSALNYIPIALGGNWNGSSFNIQFGVIPTGQAGAGSAVTNLNADLTAVFGASWATNPGNNTGVHWGVAGATATAQDNVPFNGLPANTVFLTRARTVAGTQSANLGAGLDNLSAASGINSAVNGTGAFVGRTTTDNSTKATVQTVASANSWGGYVPITGASFSSGINITQGSTGINGPTNSILDFWEGQIDPNTSNNVSTHLGIFTLNSSGVLTYAAAVPEPSTYAAMVAGGAFLLTFSRRRPVRA